MNNSNIEYREFSPTDKEKETLNKVVLDNKLYGKDLRTLVSKSGENYIIYVGSANPYQGGSGVEYTLYKESLKLVKNYTEELAPAPHFEEE